jgi:hypothetical protein
MSEVAVADARVAGLEVAKVGVTGLRLPVIGASPCPVVAPERRLTV